MSTSIGHSPNDLEAQVTEASATQSTTRPTIADEGTSTTSSPVSDPENTANDGFVESASSRPWDRPYDGFEVCTTSDIAPPPYRASMSIDPPEYTRNAEPETLAMYLFKFGFLFPPFWVLGALILGSPLRAPESAPSSLSSNAEPIGWLPGKTEAERQEILAQMRKAEMKWAWRCLVALLLVVVVASVIGAVAWATKKA